jgi:hypothetical protein
MDASSKVYSHTCLSSMSVTRFADLSMVLVLWGRISSPAQFELEAAHRQNVDHDGMRAAKQ